MGNSFGSLLRVTTFGESHGSAVGMVLDGFPAGISLDLDKVQSWLDRRRPGQSSVTSPRSELDRVECLSGISSGKSLGSPITLIVRNTDHNPNEYDHLKNVFRPSHADYTTLAKYGVSAPSGGGRSSARETIGRVAAAALVEQLLEHKLPSLSVVGFVESVKDINGVIAQPELLTRSDVEQSKVRCPDLAASKKMEDLIRSTKESGDTLGGIIYVIIKGCPAGLGDPVFDKLEADLAKAMLSLPACRGFEIGSGFAAAGMLGSEHNDEMTISDGRIGTATNRSGGIQGGISNGEAIYFRVAFKPVSTIGKPQKTVSLDGRSVILQPNPSGRHDPCVLPRAVPMVEAMSLLVIGDHFLRQVINEL